MKNQSENKVYTLAEVLGKHTIAELKQMTQVLEVKVLSKAKKQEIIDALSAKLLDKELLTAWLLAAGKQEIEELELAMASMAPERTSASQISMACSPVSGWLTSRLLISTPSASA